MSRYLVTGGGGFVGAGICRALIRQGHSVKAIARGDYPELQAAGVQFYRCDLGEDLDILKKALEGVTGVFHVASKVDSWGSREEFYKTNVLGTQNVIAACRQAGVRNLVYTSTPSVVECGSNLVNGDESIPYPKSFDALYPETKALAEREILAANGASLRTISLRPHLIWGPGDTHLVPMILERARLGRLVKIGAGDNLVDVTYIDDCVNAHLAAMDALVRGRSEAAGKAYFISQGEPVRLWDWINSLLAMHGLPPVTKSVNYYLAMTIAGAMELVAAYSAGRYRPLFTRFLVRQMARSHYFKIDQARALLDYSPQYSIARAYQTYQQALAA